MPAAVAAAFTLLAEAMIAIAFGHNWHASWWEWHVLMAVAFGLVAFVARLEYRRRRSTAAVFKDLYLEHTGELIDRRYASALSASRTRAPDTKTLREREHFSDEEAQLLEQAAGELRRLDELFSPYLSPQLMNRLREQPGAGELGGEQREISVLFADLQGFTAFSERSTPAGGGRDAERVLGRGRSGGRGRGRDDRALRGRCRAGRLQRGHRPARSRAASRESRPRLR